MALITTSKELKANCPVAAAIGFEKINPFIDPVETKYLRPAIGKDMLAELQTLYTNSIADESPTALSANIEALHKLCIKAIGELALFEGSADIQVSVSASSMQRIETGSNKSAYQYQALDWKATRKNQGFQALAQIIEYLEENVAEDDFDLYEVSPERTARLKLFVPNLATFNKYSEYTIDHWTLNQLQAIMARVENLHVSGILGDNYATIQASIAADSLTADQQAILNEAQPLIVHQTMADALQPLAINIGSTGVTLFNTTGSRSEQSYEPVSTNKIFQLETRWQNLASTYSSRLKDLVSDDEDASEITVSHPLDADQKGFAML